MNGKNQGTKIPREKVLLSPEILPSGKCLAEPEELEGFLSFLPAKPQLHKADTDWVCFNASCLH